MEQVFLTLLLSRQAEAAVVLDNRVKLQLPVIMQEMEAMGFLFQLLDLLFFMLVAVAEEPIMLPIMV